MSDEEQAKLEALLENASQRGALKAIEIMQQKVYIEVGKNVLNRTFWIAGVLGVGGYFYLKSKGFVS